MYNSEHEVLALKSLDLQVWFTQKIETKAKAHNRIFSYRHICHTVVSSCKRLSTRRIKESIEPFPSIETSWAKICKMEFFQIFHNYIEC
ncbi:hypothetical protein Mapa_011109 [Marchantia paleacea]|nr:hypothetical protein Mapa_011109 [Marchantia paleacea]